MRALLVLLVLLIAGPALATPPLHQWIDCLTEQPFNGNIKRKTEPKCYYFDSTVLLGDPFGNLYVEEAALVTYDQDITDDANHATTLYPKRCMTGQPASTFAPETCHRTKGLRGYSGEYLLNPNYAGADLAAVSGRLMRGLWVFEIGGAQVAPGELALITAEGVAQMPGGP